VQDERSLAGINIWLWERIADDLNLHYEMKQMNFRDMLEALKTGEIDLSINPLTITSERSKNFEFTNSYYAAHSTIAISEAAAYEKFKSFFKKFFNQDFLKGLFALLVIIFGFGLVGWYFERKENPEEFRNNSNGIWDGIWWSVVTLTTDKPEGFVAFQDRKVGTIANSGAMDYLKEHFFKDVNGYAGVKPGLEDLKNRKITAFLYDEPILKFRIQEDPKLSNLQVLPVKFDVQFYAFGLSTKRGNLEKEISQQILSITETQEWEVVLNEYGLTDF